MLLVPPVYRRARGEVTKNTSGTTLTSNNDANTWAFSVPDREWENWVDDTGNFGNEVRPNEFKDYALEHGPLTEQDSDYVTRALYMAFDLGIALTAPEGVGVAVSALQFLSDLALNPEEECDDDADTDTADIETIEWRWCNEEGLAVSTKSLEVEVEKGSGPATVMVEHEVEPVGDFITPNVCKWEINCPDTEANAEWTVTKETKDL